MTLERKIAQTFALDDETWLHPRQSMKRTCTIRSFPSSSSHSGAVSGLDMGPVPVALGLLWTWPGTILADQCHVRWYGIRFGGLLPNYINICGSRERMNVWYKKL